ncbi:McrC family protein [Nocardiopsis exhalans]|uniref:McrC family protein n=1 Tax=Nocardiopsis exhalans TaxID=163604 RepID=A0ABY5DGM3_9ACTN|nr:McrC family protein [Nocardiopsis exhalans]USY22539.1 McrC family protein [Nocardiopsis exhalans]
MPAGAANPRRIDLTETGPGALLALTPPQVATLTAAAHLVRVESGGAPGRWRLSARQRVGAVRLGSGEGAVELRIRPKVAVDRLMYLLGFGSGPRPWQAQTLPAEVSHDLVPAFAEVFAQVVSRVLGTGVLHGYREREDELNVVRGRVRVREQMRRGFGAPIPLAVAYDDFTPDIPENRILLAAIRALSALPGVQRRTARNLHHQAARLSGVAELRPGPLPAWTRDRLNERYAPALRLAETVLGGSGVEHTGRHDDPWAGARELPGLVVDMARVFEDFLSVALGSGLAAHGLRCATQEPHHRLDEAGRIRIRPDLVVRGRDGIRCVVDAKYKDLKGGLPSTTDLYQMVSYCTALGCERAHLVYAGGAGQDDTHSVLGAPISVHVHVLDPSGPVADLENRVRALTEAVAG